MSTVERIQAPSGGVNKDASADYLKPTQALNLENMLPARDGKAVVRGPIRKGTFTQALTDTRTPRSFWAFDDTVLMKADSSGGVKAWKVALSTQTITDVTASLAFVPYGTTGDPTYTHARYGDSVYAPIEDAAGYALGKWNGNVTIAKQTNAPYNFTDLQVFAQRLFALGGTLPGTTTPAINSNRVLFWTDPVTAGAFADLSLTASWTDDVSGLVNQIRYDADDTPVALAGCGKFLAIIGSRSINILTGSGASSFTVRNLTRNLGCVARASVVEVEDGFYFMSDRGYAFCDGVTVTVVSNDVTVALALEFPADWSAAAMNDGWISLANSSGASCWLMHIASRSWTNLSWSGISGVPGAAFRSLSYPLLYQQGYLLLADWVTQPERFGVLRAGLDYNGSSDVAIAAELRSRTLRLSGPTNRATVARVTLDYLLKVAPGESATADHSFTVTVFSGTDSALVPTAFAAPAQRNTASLHRQRAQFDIYAETDSIYLQILLTPVGTAVPLYRAEIYDAYVEYEPAQRTAGF